MATVSSHILDSITGGSAAGIRAELFQSNGGTGKTLVFDVFADVEGRICESVDSVTGSELELVLHSADYFSKFIPEINDRLTVKTVVVRFAMPGPEMRYHIPVMLSPHSYSVWWSK